MGTHITYQGDLSEEILSMHYEIAHDLLPDVKYPGDTLLKFGYIQVDSVVYHHPIIHKKATQKQLRTLERIKPNSKLNIKKRKIYPL